MRHRLLPAIAAGLVALLAACGGDRGSADRPDIDARSYYEQYTGGSEMATAAVPAAAPSGGVTDASRQTAGDAETMISPIEPSEPDWPDPTEDNVFVDGGDSRFVSTADDAESTFALDVDTGSYRVGLAQLDGGVLPDPASIRVEEWINAYDYDDEAPSDGGVGVSVETASAPHTDDGTQLVRVAVDTATLADGDRPPANITFVVDTSGSMDIRDRLGLVQSSLALLVQHLDDDDTIAVVTYGDDARPVLPATPVADADAIIAAIDDLVSGGSTNMEAGLLLGYEQARDAFRPDGVNVVVLASDGVANVGSTDAGVLVEQIEEAGEEGIHLVTVGYGMGNYNDHLMEQLADQGDGFYSYVDTFEEAERLFVEELTPTLTVAARDAKVQVRFDPATVESYRLIGYENRQLDDGDFRDDAVDAGELGNGHAVTALYEVRPTTDVVPSALRGGAAVAAPQPDASLGSVTVRWLDPATGAASERTADIGVVAAGTPGSPSLRLAATVAGVAELLRGNHDVADRGVTLDDLAADADDLAAADVPGAADLQSLVELARRAAG